MGLPVIGITRMLLMNLDDLLRVRYVTSNKRLNFGGDPYHGVDPEIFTISNLGQCSIVLNMDHCCSTVLSLF